MSNSFQNESLQKQLEVVRSRSAEARRRLTHHDPRRQPQGVIRLAGEPGHPIVGLGQPDRPTPADAKVEAATDLRGRSRVIRTPAFTDTNGESRPRGQGANAAPARRPISRRRSPPAASPDCADRSRTRRSRPLPRGEPSAKPPPWVSSPSALRPE